MNSYFKIRKTKRTHAPFSFASLYGRRGYRTLNPRRKSSESTWNRVVWLMPWLKVSNKNNCAADYYTLCFTPTLHLPFTPSSVHVPSPYVYRPLRSLLRLVCFCWRVSAFFLSVFCSLPPANQSFLYPSSLSPGHWNWKCNPVGWRPMITTSRPRTCLLFLLASFGWSVRGIWEATQCFVRKKAPPFIYSCSACTTLHLFSLHHPSFILVQLAPPFIHSCSACSASSRFFFGLGVGAIVGRNQWIERISGGLTAFLSFLRYSLVVWSHLHGSQLIYGFWFQWIDCWHNYGLQWLLLLLLMTWYTTPQVVCSAIHVGRCSRFCGHWDTEGRECWIEGREREAEGRERSTESRGRRCRINETNQKKPPKAVR